MDPDPGYWIWGWEDILFRCKSGGQIHLFLAPNGALLWRVDPSFGKLILAPKQRFTVKVGSGFTGS